MPHALESSAAEFLKSALDAPRRQFALPGLGDTWRLLAPGLSGGGVTLNGSLVHLSAFRA